jgi:hypothetical protein
LEVDDPLLRGLALEYLESALPQDIGMALLNTIQGSPQEATPAAPLPRPPDRPVDAIREEFMTLLKRATGDKDEEREPATINARRSRDEA